MPLVRATTQGIFSSPTYGRKTPHKENSLTPPYVYRYGVSAIDSDLTGVPSFVLSGERLGKHTLFIYYVPHTSLVGTMGINNIGSAARGVTMALFRDMRDADPLSSGADIPGLTGINTFDMGPTAPAYWRHVPVALNLLATGGVMFLSAEIGPFQMAFDLDAGEYKLAIFGNVAQSPVVDTCSIILQHTE